MQRAIDLNYAGSISFGSATLTTSASPSSALDTDATDGLHVAIDKCSVAWTESGPPYTYTCGGSTSTVLASSAAHRQQRGAVEPDAHRRHDRPPPRDGHPPEHRRQHACRTSRRRSPTRSPASSAPGRTSSERHAHLGQNGRQGRPGRVVASSWSWRRREPRSRSASAPRSPARGPLGATRTAPTGLRSSTARAGAGDDARSGRPRRAHARAALPRRGGSLPSCCRRRQGASHSLRSTRARRPRA